METTAAISVARQALDQGKGILRLAPTWVPRSFCVPGRRIKLHPDDYYILGGQRGGIDERWLSVLLLLKMVRLPAKMKV